MADLDGLLEKTSRTFALAIPLLPEPTRREVTIAYLLFRVADTLEDAARWKRERRRGALREFVDLLLHPDAREASRALSASWLSDPPLDHAGYLELLRELPAVWAELDSLAPKSREIIVRHTARTCEGMAKAHEVARVGLRLERHAAQDRLPRSARHRCTWPFAATTR